jgi:hypothetical protein
MCLRRVFAPACLAVAAAAVAAGAQRPSARIGLFAGLNEARIDGSTVSDISNHSAGAFGAYVVTPIGGDWSVQTGVALSMKGWERDEPATRDLSVIKLTYLEVPLLLRYDIAARERAGAFLFAGPGFGFRTGCSIAATTHATGVTQSASCDDIERLSNGQVQFKSFDQGAIFGGGVRLGIGRELLVLNTQYELGMARVEHSNNAKNRTFTVGVGFEVPLHR